MGSPMMQGYLRKDSSKLRSYFTNWVDFMVKTRGEALQVSA